MRLVTIIFIINIFIFKTFGEDIEIGQVVILKGEAQVVRNSSTINMQINDSVNELDIITTSEKSLIKITFIDKTNLILGPSSELKIEQFSKKDRINIFNFLKGNFRVKVQEKVTANQKVEFLSNQVAIGVRGTEFLANSYMANSKKVSDVALLEGKLNTAVAQTKSFTLKAGEVINTNTYKASKEISKIDPKLFEELLKDELKLLPNLLSPTAPIRSSNTDSTSTSTPSVALPLAGVGIAIGSSIGTSPTIGSKALEEEKPKESELIIVDKSNLKNEPWDIRDAILRQKELRSENICFYWFYKSLPGSGELERFRRERDCDEFENDL